MSDSKNRLPTEARSAEVEQFLENLRNAPPAHPGGRGRLIFALDATASREPTWDRACRIQGEMFEATAGLGGLEIQLVFYRGFSECKSSKWMTTAAELHRVMRSVFCVGGETQIERVLSHAIRATRALSRGAYLRFDLSSADRLKELLGAVAVYAAGGYRALTDYSEKKGGEILRLTAQLRE